MMNIAKIILQPLISFICLQGYAQETIIKYLSGTDKDHTVNWDFYCTGGRNSGQWTKIKVPSNWELQGFGTYNYGHDQTKSNERGLYKFDFSAGNLRGKKVFIVFEGSMTDTRVMVNGKLAGPIHQGSFYRFSYDITSLLKPDDKNLLEVTVDKTSANASVNDAERRNSDFWVFGGIFRPVYLEIVPVTHIERLAIDAKADGSFEADIFTQNLSGNEIVEAEVQNLKGEKIGHPMIARNISPYEKLHVVSDFGKPLLWSAEFPNLYQVVVTITNKTGLVHRFRQKFGFRTVELRSGDGLYLNGTKIILKGCNRHSFWPETGRTLSYDVHVMDVMLMKEMNMNAVRMSHYPPDPAFLDVCDSLGLYVLDELTGWQAKYDTMVGILLVKELVVRDVNHASVIFWDNGNEGGWNTGLDNDFALYDPQKRTVLHPWAKFNGTDTKHYPDFNYLVQSAASGKDVFFPTEFMHGLYDGGAGAGLDDFWTEMLKNPRGAGGFIWAFLDESVIRTDQQGKYDGDGNHAPDGIVGPHREKEASFSTIKEIWSPVYIGAPPVRGSSEWSIAVENRYSFTNFDQCVFKWKLVRFPSAYDRRTKYYTIAGGSCSTHVKPGGKGVLHLLLPSSWAKSDALYLSAYDPGKKEIFTWTWTIPKHALLVKRYISPAPPAKITSDQTEQMLHITCNRIGYYFDKTTGYIQKIVSPAGNISLSGGPALAGTNTYLKQFKYQNSKGQYIVEAEYGGTDSLSVKWTFTTGSLVKLEYHYTRKGDVDFSGISFNYPEENITGMKWLGRGPFRVWKNRLKGQQFGIWHKSYNNTITGESWKYPEFKGYHAEINWVVIENKESPMVVFTNEQMYLQMLHPEREKDALKNNNVEPAFPAGSIGFLQIIPAMGTKFQTAAVMGPQSEKFHADGKPVSGTLWFDFGGNKIDSNNK